MSHSLSNNTEEKFHFNFDFFNNYSQCNENEPRKNEESTEDNSNDDSYNKYIDLTFLNDNDDKIIEKNYNQCINHINNLGSLFHMNKLYNQFTNYYSYNPNFNSTKFQHSLNMDINISDIKSGKEKRMTIRMMNIPAYYKPKDLAEKIDQKFGIKHEKENRNYNFIYIPASKNKNIENDCYINSGYAFINFMSPKHIIKFYNLFNGKKLKSNKSQKVCIITFASKQGIGIDTTINDPDKYILFKDTKNHFELLND